MTGTRGWVFAMALLLCAPLAARGGFRCPAKGGAEWREYRSKHFVVDTDAGRLKVELLVKQLERMHALELQALFGEQVDIPGRVRVLAFADPSFFTEVAGKYVGAFYQRSRMGEPTIVLPIVGLQAQPETVAHEIAHHLSRFQFPWQPPWFSEGLAAFVQTIGNVSAPVTPAVGSHIVRSDPDQGGAVGSTPRNMVNALERARRVRVQELLYWDGRIDSDTSAQHLYSWLLYHWLWNNRSKQLSAFQQRLSNGEDPAAALRAELPELDPGNSAALAKVDDALESYRRSGLVASYRVNAEIDASFAETSLLSSAEVHMLVLETGYRSNAKDLLADIDEALSEDALHPVAIVAKSAADKSSPVAALQGAVAARPDDWRAWLLLGNALGERSKDEKEAAYRKAVALNPDSAWAHNDLAHLLATHGRAKEALPIANRALDLGPADPSSIHTLAMVAAELGKCSEALVLERRAVAVADPKAPGAQILQKRLAGLEARCGTAAPTAASPAPAP
jgi:tetratricopeptide (TPR) repeat protein